MENKRYVPPEVWKWETESGGHFASINRPIAGPTHEKGLPAGKHPLQLYSLATPNGVKVTIMLEELLEQGIAQAEYDAHLIRILEGDQFSSGFVKVNPNSKIPALLDQNQQPPVRVFESGTEEKVNPVHDAPLGTPCDESGTYSGALGWFYPIRILS